MTWDIRNPEPIAYHLPENPSAPVLTRESIFMSGYDSDLPNYALSNFFQGDNAQGFTFQDPMLGWIQFPMAEHFFHFQKLILDTSIRQQVYVAWCPMTASQVLRAQRTLFKTNPNYFWCTKRDSSPRLVFDDKAWAVFNPLVQMHINWAKYTQSKQFQACIEHATELGLVLGDNRGAVVIIEDTASKQGYRPDNIHGTGPTGEGLNNLGVSQIAFADWLRLSEESKTEAFYPLSALRDLLSSEDTGKAFMAGDTADVIVRRLGRRFDKARKKYEDFQPRLKLARDRLGSKEGEVAQPDTGLGLQLQEVNIDEGGVICLLPSPLFPSSTAIDWPLAQSHEPHQIFCVFTGSKQIYFTHPSTGGIEVLHAQWKDDRKGIDWQDTTATVKTNRHMKDLLRTANSGGGVPVSGAQLPPKLQQILTGLPSLSGVPESWHPPLPDWPPQPPQTRVVELDAVYKMCSGGKNKELYFKYVESGGIEVLHARWRQNSQTPWQNTIATVEVNHHMQGLITGAKNSRYPQYPAATQCATIPSEIQLPIVQRQAEVLNHQVPLPKALPALASGGQTQVPGAGPSSSAVTHLTGRALLTAALKTYREKGGSWFAAGLIFGFFTWNSEATVKLRLNTRAGKSKKNASAETVKMHTALKDKTAEALPRMWDIYLKSGNGNVLSAVRIFGLFSYRTVPQVKASLEARAAKDSSGASNAVLGEFAVKYFSQP